MIEDSHAFCASFQDSQAKVNPNEEVKDDTESQKMQIDEVSAFQEITEEMVR